MHYLVIFFIVLIIIVFLLLNQKVKILLQYIKDSDNDNIVLSFSTFGGLVKYKYNIPFIKAGYKGIKSRLIRKKRQKDKTDSDERKNIDFKEAIDRYKYLKEFFTKNRNTIKYLKRKTAIDELYLNIIAGTEDAAYTGILGGLLWIVAGTVEALFCNSFRVKQKKTIVRPDFSKKVFKIDSHCIFSIKLANIILVTFKLIPCYVYKLLFIKKIKK